MKFNIYDYSDLCIASDTDSCFFTAVPQLIKKLGKEYNILEEDIISTTVSDIAQENSDMVNKFLIERNKKLFNVNDSNIEFKTETIIRSAYWSGKRRYAQFIISKEGNKTEEFSIMGLDLMKSNFPKYFRDFGEQVIKDILFQNPQSKIDKDIQNFKQSISKTDWKLLLKPTGIKKLEEYIELPPTKGRIFSTLKSRTPINTRAASYTNDLLRFKKLNIKYPEFRVGDKMYYAYLKPNAYNINVIGFNGYNDPPEIIELVEKYIDKELLFDSVLKNKLENLYNDIGWKFPSLNPNVNKFFTFV